MLVEVVLLVIFSLAAALMVFALTCADDAPDLSLSALRRPRELRKLLQRSGAGQPLTAVTLSSLLEESPTTAQATG